MKIVSYIVLLVGSIFFSSCNTVNYINTEELQSNYEKKIHNTTFLGKVLFKTDKKKLDTYNNVKVFMNEQEVGRNFEVVAYGAYTPIVFPIIRPERPRIEKYLFWNAAIIDNKNNFRIIKYK